MKYVLRKASDDDFIEIVDYNLEQINSLAYLESIIIQHNFWFNENNVKQYINRPESFCNEIVQIPLEILIYDDYIE